MNLDDLRHILLSERETGRLIYISPDVFERAHSGLASLTKKVYALNDPFSDEARTLIDEMNAVRQTLQDLFIERSTKILRFATLHAEGHYYDREEIRRMIPAEKEMFDQVTVSIGRCQGSLIFNRPHIPGMSGRPPLDDERTGEPVFASGDPSGSETVPLTLQPLEEPVAPADPSVLVRVLEDMDPFMGVDGRVYTLSKGDIVTLPERNAVVLSDRNIVLNINLCK